MIVADHTGPDKDGWESKSIYLRKDGEKGFYGFHAGGMTREDGTWANMEAWVNCYDENKKFIASVSRVFGPIEEAAQGMVDEGWTVVSDWENNERK
jgi:hypothetical protein